jgi:FrmR/RcnR family transcriptional regulator, repressor of rcnA expression
MQLTIVNYVQFCNLLANRRLEPSNLIPYPPRVYKKNAARKVSNFMKDKLPAIPKEKQKLLSRIKRMGGQLVAAERAVMDGDECADILMLLAAIRGGVNSLMAEILEDHIRLHITHPDRGPESSEELTEDLISLVRAYLK